MIDRFLRRLSVRMRIVGGFVILLAVMTLFAPLLVTSRSFIVARLRQITEVETRADRLLLLASARIESSRVNTMRYIQDYAPSAYEALDDVDQASAMLTEAEGLSTSPEQQGTVDTILAALGDYRVLIQQIEAARVAGEEQDVSRLLFQAYRLGNDIGQRIEQIAIASEARFAAGNQAILAEIQDRLILVGIGYVVAIALALTLSSVIQRSITRPVAELRQGAEAFSQGEMDVSIPVVGSDELSLLARTFNQLTSQLRDLIGSLERRVADRTHDLEQRAVQLSTAADVGRAAASILDLEALGSEVVELVRGRFDLYYAGLFLLDEQGRYANLVAGSGEAGQIMKSRGHRLEVGGTSMVGTACSERQARIALDVGAESVRFDNPLLPDTRSEMALPLMVADQVLGALDVQSTQPAAFSEEDIAVLQLMADQVAVAIQNARLFRAAQEALEAERRAYGEISQQAWVHLIRAQEVRPGYVSDESGVHSQTEIESSYARAAFRQGQSVPGSNGAASMAIPIRVRDQVIGVIDAQKPDGFRGWTSDEIALLESLTDQLGVALDSARLYQDVQRRATRERLVGEVTTRIRESLDVEKVLQTAVDEIAGALGLAALDLRLVTEQDFGDDLSAPPNEEALASQ